MSRPTLWVFGYGSLMWRPGFAHVEQVKARLTGRRRALCVYSVHHRGTTDRPGLVFGLDIGGACNGVAFRVADCDRDETIAYLRERELVTGIYHECVRNIRLLDGSGHDVAALCYVVDIRHPQYARGHDLAQQARIIEASRGQSGPNTDYVINTAAHLSAIGIRDRQLERLVARLGAMRRKFVPLRMNSTIGPGGGAVLHQVAPPKRPRFDRAAIGRFCYRRCLDRE